MSDQAGCWSGLRTLFKTRKSPRPEEADRNKQHAPTGALINNLPPTYDSHQVSKQDVGYRNHFYDWSPPEKRAPREYSEKLELPNPGALDTSDERIVQLDSALRDLNVKIHDRPELGWNVGYAHDLLTQFLEEHGFTVTRHYLSDRLPGNTAWRGEFTIPSNGHSSLPVVGFNSEMDALPGVGHACGHNLIAVAGVAAALGLKDAMEKHNIPGKIVILGTPAEESGAGKEHLLRAGAYNDMDVCLMAHPGPGDEYHKSVWTGGSLALESFTVEYHGQTAHAGAAPWEGRNALDAAFVAYAAISALRQQIHPSARVHGMIAGQHWAPNIIQDYARMTYYVRAPSWDQVTALRQRVNKCFEAAALATSCTMTVKNHEPVKDLQQNSVLSDDFAAVMVARYNRPFIPDVPTGASTDFVSNWVSLPSIHSGFSIPTIVGGGNHTPAYTAAARTKEAHENAMAVAKGLSAVGLHVLLDPEFRQSVKDAFKKQFPQ
ncbi:amidohydrolase family protein [Ceratobasidium sp. AG-Ba]|nr:amidohydrolase family protein [Ceratobasidium sp. AG-Ba]